MKQQEELTKQKLQQEKQQQEKQQQEKQQQGGQQERGRYTIPSRGEYGTSGYLGEYGDSYYSHTHGGDGSCSDVGVSNKNPSYISEWEKRFDTNASENKCLKGQPLDIDFKLNVILRNIEELKKTKESFTSNIKKTSKIANYKEKLNVIDKELEKLLKQKELYQKNNNSSSNIKYYPFTKTESFKNVEQFTNYPYIATDNKTFNKSNYTKITPELEKQYNTNFQSVNSIRE